MIYEKFKRQSLQNEYPDRHKVKYHLSMFVFFRFCSFIFVFCLCSIGLMTLSDVFIHDNTKVFQWLTVAFGSVFIAIGLTWLLVYKNFSQLDQASSTEKTIQKPLKNLMLILGIVVLFMTFIFMGLGYGMLSRMLSGTALLG